MSASEKLKALESSLNAGDLHSMLMGGDDTEDEAALKRALPQLVAVVEAAEDIPDLVGGAWPDLSAALAALDETLP